MAGSIEIEDGTGKGLRVKVDGSNRMRVNAVNRPVEAQANLDEDAFNINTKSITLTSADESAVIYVKNNEDRDLVISAIAVGVGPSTNGVATDIPDITIIRNPTAGTIVSNAVALNINSNRNFGSPKLLTIDAFKGVEGDTLTDGTDHLFFFQNEDNRLFAPIDEVLPKGSSIGAKINPVASNSNMRIYVALICHLRSLTN